MINIRDKYFTEFYRINIHDSFRKLQCIVLEFKKKERIISFYSLTIQNSFRKIPMCRIRVFKKERIISFYRITIHDSFRRFQCVVLEFKKKKKKNYFFLPHHHSRFISKIQYFILEFFRKRRTISIILNFPKFLVRCKREYSSFSNHRQAFTIRLVESNIPF